jgi:hypothetical protein
MIYILAGNDLKKRNAHIKTLAKDREITRLSFEDQTKEMLERYASNTSLFGGQSIIIVENTLKQSAFSADDLKRFGDSENIFIFLEDKLLVADERKYKKYAAIEKFEEKVKKALPKVNTFAIAEAFGKKDKMKTWMLYINAIEQGAQPEAISGMLFWKIKALLQDGTKAFSIEELKNHSGAIVSLYHQAHKGERDFIIGLEQFILSSLSK